MQVGHSSIENNRCLSHPLLLLDLVQHPYRERLAIQVPSIVPITSERRLRRSCIPVLQIRQPEQGPPQLTRRLTRDVITTRDNIIPGIVEK